MSVFNCAYVDTNPGSSPENPFCPPLGFKGSPNEFYKLCRDRFDNDLMFKMRMNMVVSFSARPNHEVHKPLEVVGPYREQVLKILKKLTPNPSS